VAGASISPVPATPAGGVRRFAPSGPASARSPRFPPRGRRSDVGGAFSPGRPCSRHCSHSVHNRSTCSRTGQARAGVVLSLTVAHTKRLPKSFGQHEFLSAVIDREDNCVGCGRNRRACSCDSQGKRDVVGLPVFTSPIFGHSAILRAQQRPYRRARGLDPPAIIGRIYFEQREIQSEGSRSTGSSAPETRFSTRI
jgi:hypothetical protein